MSKPTPASDSYAVDTITDAIATRWTLCDKCGEPWTEHDEYGNTIYCVLPPLSASISKRSQ